MKSEIIRHLTRFGCLCLALGAGANAALGQNFRYEARPRVEYAGMNFSSPEPAPRMMPASDAARRESERPDRGYLYARYDTAASAPRSPRISRGPILSNYRNAPERVYGEPTMAEPLPGGQTADPFGEVLPDDGSFDPSMEMEGDPLLTGPCPTCGSCTNCTGFFRCFWGCLHNTCLFSPILWQNFNEFGGVQGFKGPADMGVNGNFGFHKGINWASPLWDRFGIGFQLGAAIAVSDLEGNSSTFRTTREQYFVTTGLFRRANCNKGFQGGAVLDYLSDQFYVSMNLLQVRAEISYQNCGREVGIWAAAHTNSDTKTPPVTFELRDVTWQANNQYNLFYRQRFCNGGVGRMWIGLTDYADVIFGSDATAPLSERWAIQGSYNYLLPRNNDGLPKNVAESWNLSISLVWYPGYKVPNACFNPYRPLFTVADNGTFMERTR